MSQNASAVVFPGQGSQRSGMARDFYDEYERSRQTFEEANEAVGEDISAICFADDDPRLNLTEFTQPCILTAEMAIYRVLNQEFGFDPDFFAGHSLGEYTALAAAGVIPFADAVRIVRRRGALMQRAVPEGIGAMAAVILPDIESTSFREIVEKNKAEIANLNSSEQVVISGRKEYVEAAAEEIRRELKVSTERGEELQADVRFLEVSAPFHSSLMREIESEFREYLTQFMGRFQTDRVSAVLSNFSARLHERDTLLDNLVHQISGPVRWVENMRLLAEKAKKIYEVGPNRPLGKFFQSIGQEVKSIINVRSLKKAFGSLNS